MHEGLEDIYEDSREAKSRLGKKRIEENKKNSAVSSQAGNRREQAVTGGRPWKLMRRPEDLKTEAVTGGRPSKPAAARACGDRIGKSVYDRILSF